MSTKPTLPAARPPGRRRARSPGPDKAMLHRQVDALQARVAALESRLEAMRQSTSWRISAPVRWLSRQVQRMRGVGEGPATRRADTYAEWVRLYDTVDAVDGSAPCQAGAGISVLVMAPRADECNEALRRTPGRWIVLTEPGDVLPPYALGHLAEEIGRHPDARLIFTDDDLWDHGERADPRFKPDWNRELFYTQDLFSGFCAIERSLVEAVGGFRDGFDGAMRYDLALRCIENLRPDQIHHIPRVLCHRIAENATRARQADVRRAEAAALADHFRRTGIAAQVVEDETGRRVRYKLPAELPRVTLIIPTRNALALLRQCVESIVELTLYPNYEILVVDNGSDDPDTLAWLAAANEQPGIRVLRDDGPFNYSALNNRAVAEAEGEFIALVNNDIEVISPDWLGEMISLALQPGVGPVGAKLLYPDETLQHGGVLLGVGGVEGVAGHANKLLPAWQGGYMERGLAVQSFSAVTAACLVVRKALYEQVGGLDEVNLKIAYNDIDFCLRLRATGYRAVWTPWAELFHHESATRGADTAPDQCPRFEQERAYMRQRWSDLIANDPAYNPNLTIHVENFGLAWPPRVPWIHGAARP